MEKNQFELSHQLPNSWVTIREAKTSNSFSHRLLLSFPGLGRMFRAVSYGIIFAALSCVSLSANAGSAGAQTKDVECRAVDKLAILYLSKRHRVATHEDKENKTCKFSIDGAVLTKPKYEAKVQKALKDIDLLYDIYSKDQTHQRENEFNQALSNLKGSMVYLYATAGPSTDGSVPSKLFEAVSKNEELITGCLRDFYRGKSPNKIAQDKRVSCKVLGLKSENRVEALQTIVNTGDYKNGLYTFR